MKDAGSLFLTLYTFSLTGGVEKVCRILGKALYDLSNGNEKPIKVFSLHDKDGSNDSRYIPTKTFRHYNGNKLAFVANSIKEGTKKNVVILSHINLLTVGFIIKLLSPKTKLVLLAHGIEVWNKQPAYKKWMIRKVDKVAAVSQFTLDRMKVSCNLKTDQSVVLNNCLDPFLQNPETKIADELKIKYNISSSDIVLLTLSRLTKRDREKGYPKVLFAVKELTSEIPNLKYMIAGKYSQEEKEFLDQLVSHYRLEGKVIITGFIADAELASHFGVCDVYVMPSIKEGFGIIFIEAMYYGLPVIAGNKDGSLDALGQGELGILVDPSDNTAIQKAIKDAILNRKDFVPDITKVLDLYSYSSYKNKVANILASLN